MRRDEFLEKVRDGAGLDDLEAADRLTGAVLTTLGERVRYREAKHLAAQLPKELKERLLQLREDPRIFRTTVPRFNLEEFYNRIRARAGCGYPMAVRGARAVAAVLRQAVAPGELSHILAELPPEYDELFGAPPSGAASPTTREKRREP